MRSFLLTLFFLIWSLAAVQAQDTKPCPTISVTGPPGIIEPGEVALFSAQLDGYIPPSVTYFWTISDGEIVSGQNTLCLQVRFPSANFVESLSASLEIRGLPVGCPNTVSETYAVAIDDLRPVLFDEYGNIPPKQEFLRLSVAVKRLRENPNDFLVIVVYFSRASPRKRNDRIEKYLTRSLKLDKNEYKILTASAAQDRTQLYLVPPGANYPQP